MHPSTRACRIKTLKRTKRVNQIGDFESQEIIEVTFLYMKIEMNSFLTHIS